MANHKSALKRHRQSLKRKTRNRKIKSTCRTAIKNTLSAITEGDKTKANDCFKIAQQQIAKASVKKIYHKKNAARKISRLAAKLNQL